MSVNYRLTCKYCGEAVELQLEKESKQYDCGMCYASSVYWGRCNDCGTSYNLEIRNHFEIAES